MQIPIPDDWDGETWLCAKIEWPDSPMYVGLLFGLLTQLTRGRLYDSATGSIVSAQQVGEQISDRNLPLKSCADGDDIPAQKEVIYKIMSSMDSEELAMSLCGYNPKAFRVKDGTFSVRDFCGDWVEIGSVGVTSTPPIDEELVWPDDSVFSACGKAWAITDLLQKVGNTIWDQRDNDPYTAWKNVSSAYPEIMSMGWTLNGVAQAVTISALYLVTDGWYGPELFDESTWQAITCALTNQLDSTETLPDKDSLYDMVMSAIVAQWPIDVLAGAFWVDVYKAIGENDVRNAGLAGATDTGRDCECPDTTDPLGPTEPVSGGWYLGAAVEIGVENQSGEANAKLGYKSTPQHDVYGCAFVQTITGNRAGMNVKRMDPANCGVTNFDEKQSGDTSDHLEYEINGTQFASGSTSVLNLLFGVGEFIQLSSNFDSGSIPAPGMAGGLTGAFGWYLDQADPGERVDYELRYIHNINSASHS